MFCEKCGNSIPDGMKFCGFCGSPVQRRKLICPACGQEIGEGMLFCGSCGTRGVLAPAGPAPQSAPTYQAPQQEAPTYQAPQQEAPVYQAPQQEAPTYQTPPPQQGYQVPPQQGYQAPPQQGYQVPPQQGYQAGYQYAQSGPSGAPLMTIKASWTSPAGGKKVHKIGEGKLSLYRDCIVYDPTMMGGAYPLFGLAGMAVSAAKAKKQDDLVITPDQILSFRTGIWPDAFKNAFIEIGLRSGETYLFFRVGTLKEERKKEGKSWDEFQSFADAVQSLLLQNGG